MDKFDRIAHALTHTYKANLPTSPLPRPLVRSKADFFRPVDEIPRDWLCGPICSDFVDRFLAGQLSEEENRCVGFREQMVRPELIRRTQLEVAGTVLTAVLAYRYGIAANVAGGTHHAHPFGGAGFTILNDLAVAANFLTDESINHGTIQGVKRVLVIDCDVHQGDGTARFGNGPLRDRLFTLSLHCESNYPQLKARSTIDVGLPDKMRDDAYQKVLEESVEAAIDLVDPDFIFYDAGVDVYEHDKLGRLCVSEEGIRRRDRWVLDHCVSLGIPTAAVVGGGYDKDVDALARRHALVHEEASHVWRKYRMWERAQQ